MKKPLLVGCMILLVVTSCSEGAQPQEHVAGNLSRLLQAPAMSPLMMPGSRSCLSHDKDTTVVCPLARIQADAAVGNLPPYEVWYDPSIWQAVDDPMEPGLTSKENPDCFLALQGEALEATPISKVQAAGIDWSLYRGDSRTLYYSFTFQNGGYIVRLNLPEPFDETAPTSCQRMSEDIIDTFAFVQK